jgi:hypothetical protein
VNSRAIVRCAAAYVLTAALGVSMGAALAHRHNATPVVNAEGPVSLGAVVPAASSKPVKDDPRAFTMSGAVTGLVPGRPLTLPVTVNNPNSQSIRILTISAIAGNASLACPANGNIAVSTYDSSVSGAPAYIVPARGTATVPLSVRFVDAPTRNQNACKGVTFPLSYVGSAMQWGNG